MIISTVCPNSKIVYIIPDYLLVLKLRKYSSQCSSCVFFRKIEENLFWVIEAINVIVDAKAICSILHNSENNQIKYPCVQRTPTTSPPFSQIKLAKTSISRGLRGLIRAFRSMHLSILTSIKAFVSEDCVIETTKTSSTKIFELQCRQK